MNEAKAKALELAIRLTALLPKEEIEEIRKKEGPEILFKRILAISDMVLKYIRE